MSIFSLKGLDPSAVVRHAALVMFFAFVRSYVFGYFGWFAFARIRADAPDRRTITR